LNAAEAGRLISSIRSAVKAYFIGNDEALDTAIATTIAGATCSSRARLG
jgi:hypothetical protein